MNVISYCEGASKAASPLLASSFPGATRQESEETEIYGRRGNDNRECPSPWSNWQGLDYEMKTLLCSESTSCLTFARSFLAET